MKVLAIDPGTTESAYVLWDSKSQVFSSSFEPNEHLAQTVGLPGFNGDIDIAAIENVASYGMAVGKEVFQTCVWIGRFQQKLLDAGSKVELIYRQPVKLHHCHSSKAKDGNVRQALIDKYGSPGTKKNPGVTYGLKSHTWQAFALATYVAETYEGN